MDHSICCYPLTTPHIPSKSITDKKKHFNFLFEGTEVPITNYSFSVNFL